MLTGSNGGMGTRTNIGGLSSRSRAWQREETKEDDGRSLKKRVTEQGAARHSQW